ncbi:MAG: cysteine desulfurase family protein, partial [Kiloniellales bacterium]|nr:cysteine desulfurase family protein [Kiloniellales bacterium]
PAGVIFTSGGSESNNLALNGFPGHRVLISAGEHESVLKSNPRAEVVALGGDGQIDLEALETRLAVGDGPFLLSLMWANNETGVIQPLAEAARLVHQAGGLLHSDAVQAAGKISLNPREIGVDLLSISAHKLGGPQGVGALVLRERLDIVPMIKGGGQERSRRAGSENTPGIAGFGVAAALARRGLQDSGRVRDLRDRLETRLKKEADGIRIYGSEVPRLPNTSCFGLKDLRAETLVMAMDLAGIAISAGSACSSGKVQPSHVLQAMGASAAEASTAIRVSFGWDSNDGDLELFLSAWIKHMRRSLAA